VCEEKYSKDIPFIEFNKADGLDMIRAQGVKGFPTIAIYVDGKMVESTHSQDDVEPMIQKYI